MFYLNPMLLYLAPVAALVAAALVMLDYVRKKGLQNVYGDWQLLSPNSEPLSLPRHLIGAVFIAAAAAMIMVAVSRPVIQEGTRSIAQGTVSVVAVIDVSRSMAAMDYDGKVPSSAVATRQVESGQATIGPEEAGTRLEMVRHIMMDNLLPTLNGNQLGIVSYAGEAFPQAFLTRDGKALKWVVDRGLTISSAPGEGSAMGKALVLALAMFDADSPPNQEKVLILFSDGGNDDKKEVLAMFAQEARARNIKVIVVAVGNAMPAKIPVSKLAFDDPVAAGLAANGKRWYEVNGEIEKSGLNATLLQQLSALAGGQFIHLQQASDIDLFDHVGKTAVVSVEGTQELFPWALIAAFVALVLSLGATHQWCRRTTT